VRSAVERADARRRSREVSVRLWRVAPIAAGVCLVAAAVNWWARGPIALPIGLVAAAILGLVAYVRVVGRRHPVTDAMASRIDADGQFNGELRSATWFAARDARDEWTDFHLERAASRVSDVDWTTLYPSIATGRPRLVTAGLLVAAVVVGALTPGRARVEARGPLNIPVAGGVLARGKAMRLEMLPEDLRKQIEDLLASAEQQSASPQKQTAAAEMLWNMFTALNSDINAEKLKELADRMDPDGGDAAEASKTLKELAGRSVKAADTRELPKDLQRALRELGEAMTTAAEAEQQAAESNAASQSSSSGAQANANSTSGDGPQSLENAQIQMSRENDAAAGAGMMMMSSQMNAMGNPSAGFGGAGNANTQAAAGVAPLDLTEALRKETVEASADTTGDNVMSETRRKTEHGQATVGFTRSASGTSDRSRATAPPPVPEDLRGTVQSYFNRKQ
jgi:hypothetical protein